MNGLSNPAYDADGDVLHSTKVFNEDQACEEVETYNDEMPKYAVVNKTKIASTNNGMIVIETKNPPDEQDPPDEQRIKSRDFHNNSTNFYDAAVSVPTPVDRTNMPWLINRKEFPETLILSLEFLCKSI